MTLLPQDTQRDLRNLATASLSLLAFQFKCEVADILTLLNPQPSSHAPAARASAPPSDAQAEGSAPSSSATPSQAKASTDGGATEQAQEVPADGVTGDASRASLGAGTEAPNSSFADVEAHHEEAKITDRSADADSASTTTGTPANEGGEDVDPPKTRRTKNLDAALAGGTRVGETTDSAVGSGALTDFDRSVLALHQAEPALTRREIVSRLGKSLQHTSVSVRKQGLTIETGSPEVAEPVPAIDMSKLERAKPKPASPASGFTLRHRVQVAHDQHPTWTARMLANYLGANVNSVTTYLTQMRSAVDETPVSTTDRVLPNAAAGEVEARMREEARQRKARLGQA